ncbi:homoserine/threonine efflux protein [Myxococcus stipitatus DSM 14675]|uniref:Homoserine/threonine efflux protein n=1 Tax=Myxococcus stipitatus (strain DSM 14675 / JCM 12634 / Mx s8) TaxID=1278073 RepID=L7UD26_MYXSD|nr:LysE family translocator [Myxococcus stipitatus]AGC46831.1 homoserine/threonine efflux protein [Myxococcus stipitatus DSM 14675]
MLFEPTRLLAFLLAGVALNLTPGPDTMYVLARSMGQGRSAGFVSALGICVGGLFHISAAALGLSALLATSAVAFLVVKWVGALYLVWMGVQMLRSKTGPQAVEGLQPASLWRIFRDGVVTNVLNPKVAVFFLAFLPQFVDPSRGSTGLQFVLLGLLFDATGTLWLVFLAGVAGGFGAWLRRNPRFAAWQQRVTGGVFVALGARLALQERA